MTRIFARLFYNKKFLLRFFYNFEIPTMIHLIYYEPVFPFFILSYLRKLSSYAGLRKKVEIQNIIA